MTIKPDYTEECPESDWTLTFARDWSQIDLREAFETENITASWTVDGNQEEWKETFKKLNFNISFEDLAEKVAKESFKKITRKETSIPIRQDFTFRFLDDYEYSNMLEIDVVTWYFLKKTEKEKQKWLKQVKLQEHRAAKIAQTKAEAERQKEIEERKLYLNLKKKFEK